MKYYAVAKGLTPGIYTDWDTCKENVHGFPGAVYKSFPSLAEANRFLELNGVDPDTVTAPAAEDAVTRGGAGKNEIDVADSDGPVSTKEDLIAYVDGSFDAVTSRYAYGCVFVFSDGTEVINGADADPDYVEMRNVAGEILASEKAIDHAIAHGYRSVHIYYDYEGIEKWANDIWKANKVGTQRYKALVQKKREEIQVCFHKVAAHTGVTYNEMADRAAKQALGLE
ncbi:MAG: ribonuclease H family protein [Lachnospiraceae bacterium]|nr:ribonuclease H family protein [Lachnospiraceae bacterium]